MVEAEEEGEGEGEEAGEGEGEEWNGVWLASMHVQLVPAFQTGLVKLAVASRRCYPSKR